MGVARRIAEQCQVKVNALLDRAEDPREMLDYSYAQQQQFLQVMRAAVADVAASRDRARAQEDELRRAAGRLRAQAEQAIAAGQEELGRDALAHRAEMIDYADDLAAGQAALRLQQERLAEETRRLEARFEAFRHRKEALKAAYTAAKAAADEAATAAAAARAAGAPAGSFVTVPGVADAARRAEDQTAALHARAAALSEQIKAGGPGILPPLDADQVQDQLDALARDAAVDEELAKLRAQMAPRTSAQRGKHGGGA
jgi:phage shock protein A